MPSSRFSITDDDRWVLIRALDDYADDCAERAAEYRDENTTDEALHYDSDSKAAARLLERLVAFGQPS